MEGKDENDCSNSSSSSYFTSTSPLLAFCTGTGRLYFWSKKEGKVEGDIKWSDTVSPSPSSTSLSTSFDTSVNSLTAPGNLSGSTNSQKTMSTYYICIWFSIASFLFILLSLFFSSSQLIRVTMIFLMFLFVFFSCTNSGNQNYYNRYKSNYLLSTLF